MDPVFDYVEQDDGFWSSVRGVVGDVFRYKIADLTSQRDIRWTQRPDGTSLGVGADGQVYTKGLPASSGYLPAGFPLVPLALLVGGAVLAFKLLK